MQGRPGRLLCWLRSSGMIDRRTREVVDLWAEYLSMYGDRSSWATRGRGDLKQSVKASHEHWRDAVRPRQMVGDVEEGVDDALRRIEEAGDVVDRVLLKDLASKAGESPSAGVASWFTTMCWGAGPQNRVRLRQWTRALERPNLGEALGRTHQQISGGDLVLSYWGLRSLPGLGEAYLTKWLWALGLPQDSMDVRPYVLDARVWKVLRQLPWFPEGRNRAERWVDYCRTLDSWGALVSEQHKDWVADGDCLEQLMFDRGEGVHFAKWLEDR